MTIRRFLMAVAVAAVAVSGFGLSPDYVAWGEGPARHLMTKEEIAQWKAVRTDEEAVKFATLFWARRDPTPGTPRNEFREQFDLRVKQADANFTAGKVKGSMTDRGKTLVLYGMPKKIERAGAQRGAAMPQGINADPANSQMREDAETFIWTYEDEAAKTHFNRPKAIVRFVDRFGNSEFKIDRAGSADMATAEQRTITAAIRQPNLTEAPTYAETPASPTAPAPVADAAPAVQTELTTDAYKTAIADFKKAGKSPFDKAIFASTGEYVTAEGDTFVPVLLYVPGAAGISAAADQTFFGIVEDASGKSVLAFEEPAKLTATKGDFFVDKSLTLPAGKHRGYFGIAQGGKPVAMVSTDFELAGSLDKDAAASSPVLISNNVYALTAAQQPTDPFAFGGLKVVPKADRAFRSTEELSYFIELRNPGLPEIIPASDGSTPAALPKIQVKLDVEGTNADGKKVKMSAPPMEAEAFPLKGVAGHYGLGSGIPLSSFKPGDYTFTVKVIDTIKKSSYTLSEKFRIVQ
jgi:GWxTD domain-containing protein